MRVPINLASQPYENLRPLYFAAGMAAILLAALALLVVWNVQENRHETSRLTEQSDQLEKELQTIRKEQRDLQQWLERPEVLEIRDRSAFLNSIIVRKSLSWTRMFMDLESILPERVQVTSIHPSLNQDQQAELKLTVSAATVQPLVEFLKSLESAPQFGAPVVESQRFPAEKATDPNIALDLSVLYHQTPGAPASSLQESARKVEKESPPPVADAAPERPLPPSGPPAAESKPASPAAPPGGPVWNPSATPLSEVLARKQREAAEGVKQARPRKGTSSSQENDQ